jgi:hypothetical protein
MPSFAASLRLEASAYIWARKDKRDPDKGSIPIAMRPYKAAIKALSATGAEGLVGGVLPGACGSVRDRKIPKATRRNEHKCWFAPFLDFLLDRHPRDRSGRPQAYAYVVGIAAIWFGPELKGCRGYGRSRSPCAILAATARRATEVPSLHRGVLGRRSAPASGGEAYFALARESRLRAGSCHFPR